LIQNAANHFLGEDLHHPVAFKPFFSPKNPLWSEASPFMEFSLKAKQSRAYLPVSPFLQGGGNPLGG
jgi:hypothetical protein